MLRYLPFYLFALGLLAQDAILLDEARNLKPIIFEVMNVRDQSGFTATSDDQQAIALNDHYRNQNVSARDVAPNRNDALLAAFFAFADRMDGALDGGIQAPDLRGLYDLLLLKKAPMAALCLGCRFQGRWTDIRRLVKAPTLFSELPRTFTRLNAEPMTPMDKLEYVTNLTRRLIDYRSDGPDREFWQTPLETLRLKTGDCEDMALFVLSVAHHLGIDAYLAVGRALVMGEDGVVRNQGHAWIVYDQQVFDPSRRKDSAQTVEYEADVLLSLDHAHFIFNGQTPWVSQMSP